jgi:hypothetical protein
LFSLLFKCLFINSLALTGWKIFGHYAACTLTQCAQGRPGAGAPALDEGADLLPDAGNLDVLANLS